MIEPSDREKRLLSDIQRIRVRYQGVEMFDPIRDALGELLEQHSELHPTQLLVIDQTELLSTCQSAVDAFGSEHQLRKTQEECCELGAEIAHWLDGKISAEKLAKEAADVEITVTYIRLTIGDALVDEAKARKLERLRGIVRAKVESDQS